MGIDINYLAVLVAAIVNFGIGSLWYSPVLFAKQWQAYMEWTEEVKKQMSKQSMLKSMGLYTLGTLLMSYVLAHFVALSGAIDWMSGAEAGFWLWLGFVFTTSLAAIAFERKPFGLFAINVGYHFVGLVVMGVILAVWQ